MTKDRGEPFPKDAREIEAKLQEIADPGRAEVLQRFFKTAPGEYGYGDRFLGIRVPDLRKFARTLKELPIPEIVKLLRSPYHEARLLALLLLVDAYKKGDEAERNRIFDIYMKNTRYINSWDLVDLSAEHIVGAHLRDRNRERLARLAASPVLWERRIAVVATFHYIKRGEFEHTLRVAELLLKDTEDLIHKAVGWMLREVGKRDLEVEKEFLELHCRKMPRTMLRYAVETFPEPLRRRYLSKGRNDRSK